ncbi:CMP-N-acetylneuraminate-beta-galactosamide-alpha-2,3-sialyltransferase 1-like protein [Labeo rohita]|uniref:CMP-N-acetylneuraminate-beta-galactosamide-alpha-2,3-sialyltransferase 1-like protein n=1 Tax=Labeo rohita TaxID=84645 RepID=A0A498NHI6_LABRO|nr:CMP-N-acetylneuraminate-beta-galactosamide-alpha-2,3-sialyltransferase 1-like protein [Labeo rohita]
MNKAPVQGYEKDVGSRTTHRIMYPESATHLDNSTHLVLLPFKILDIQWITSALTDGSIKRTRFKVIDKLQATRDKVNVFGFGANSKGTWHHYFENTPKRFKRTGKHSGGIERATILELQERKLIDLYTGWMNKAPVQGYEKDVGSRTTHRIMYPESATHLDNSTHLVLLPFKILDIQWITSALTDGSIKRLENAETNGLGTTELEHWDHWTWDTRLENDGTTGLGTASLGNAETNGLGTTELEIAGTTGFRTARLRTTRLWNAGTNGLGTTRFGSAGTNGLRTTKLESTGTTGLGTTILRSGRTIGLESSGNNGLKTTELVNAGTTGLGT